MKKLLSVLLLAGVLSFSTGFVATSMAQATPTQEVKKGKLKPKKKIKHVKKTHKKKKIARKSANQGSKD